jgi:hypothetical protein
LAFKGDIFSLANQLISGKEYVSNEKSTKHSLIVPMIQAMGYDVFNPLEVRPEYSANFCFINLF